MNHALFSLTGRLTRRDFALTLGVISGGVFFAMLALCYLLFPLTASAAVGFFRDSTEVFFTVYIAAFLELNLLLYALIPPLAIPAVVRRLHDLGHGGGWAAPMLLLCVPVLLLMLLPVCIFIGILNEMIGPSFPLWNGATEAFASADAASVGILLLLCFVLFIPLACCLGWLFLKKGKPEANRWGDPPVEEVLPPTRAAYFSTAGTVTRTAFIRRSLLLLLALGLVLPPAAQLVLQAIVTVLIILAATIPETVEILPSIIILLTILPFVLFPLPLLPLVRQRLRTLGHSPYEAFLPFAVLLPPLITPLPFARLFSYEVLMAGSTVTDGALQSAVDSMIGVPSILLWTLCGILSLIGIIRLLANDDISCRRESSEESEVHDVLPKM
mgnify:CR=1 FL=1